MSCKYVAGDKLNLATLRHDLFSLVMPFETAIELLGEDINPNAALLQAEVLRSLKEIVQQLKALPEIATVIPEGCGV